MFRGAKNNNNIFTGNASPDAFGGGKTLVNGKSGGPPAKTQTETDKLKDKTTKNFNNLLKTEDGDLLNRPEEGKNADMYFYILIGFDVFIFLFNFYLFFRFSMYLVKMGMGKTDSYTDSFMERSKLVKALNVIIIKDFIHTMYLIVAMIISIGGLALFTVPLPIFILLVKSGWTCYWK